MPEKQTREGIEAELNASESERISLQLQEVVREAELVEKDLRALEDEHGIPEFARSYCRRPARYLSAGGYCAECHTAKMGDRRQLHQPRTGARPDPWQCRRGWNGAAQIPAPHDFGIGNG
jgi:hypothetical protein